MLSQPINQHSTGRGQNNWREYAVSGISVDEKHPNDIKIMSWKHTDHSTQLHTNCECTLIDKSAEWIVGVLVNSHWE